jgi:hypothetical protein
MLFALRFPFRRTWVPSFFAALLIECSGLHAATFTVTNANDSGVGSLRTAIQNANSAVGADLINFNIPSGPGPFTINLASALPPIFPEPVAIDGTTQAGYTDKPRIELNGTNAGEDATGIYLQSSNCVVKGLAINRFTKEAIRIEGSGNNVVQGNFIGTGPFGTNSLGNGSGGGGFGGITILSAGNLVGGNDPTNRNIISGNYHAGIWIIDPAGNGATKGNQVVGNYVGLDVTGINRLGNTENGIATYGDRNTIIGGTNVSARNVISGNYQSGIYLKSDLFFGINSMSNVIQGNFIGTDTNGTVAISNTSDGITLEGATYTVIGGTNEGARNVISGNGGRGVNVDAHGATGNLIQGNFIGADVNGSARLGNAYAGVEILNSSNNIVGGPVAGAGNVISANGLSGVSLSNAKSYGNVVQGNFIGTDVTGTNGLGNVRSGVYATNVTGNLIGGSVAGARNVISGNIDNGIWLDANTRSNQIQGNLIGTDTTGTRRLGNGSSGVRIYEASGNLVGGTTAAARNLVSGNTNTGVYLLGLASSNNIVQGNFVGTVSNGLAALGNSYTGINVENARDNTIGGTEIGARNLVSGNSLAGVYIQKINASGNVVQGNFIGTDGLGTSALANGIGLGVNTDSGGGVDIDGAPSNTIGGTAGGAGNLISGNWRDGICIGASGASNNVIQGNLIGTTIDGVSPLGNEYHNIDTRIPGGAINNLIGGSVPGAGNTIAYARTAQYDGIRVRDGNVGLLIRGNSFFSNGANGVRGMAIDLGPVSGVNTNDICDGDTGANLLQNFPALTNAISGGGTTQVQGALNSTANSTFLLQFYANTVQAASGYGEGRTYLGSTSVATDGSCNATFSVLLPVAVPAGQFITATATDAANNTSEFSANLVVLLQPILSLTYSIAPASVTLAWTNAATGFVLQEATNLINPILWSAVTNTPANIGGQFVVTLTPGIGNRFYRLALP